MHLPSGVLSAPSSPKGRAITSFNSWAFCNLKSSSGSNPMGLFYIKRSTCAREIWVGTLFLNPDPPFHPSAIVVLPKRASVDPIIVSP
ncbi:uncharacterized protein UV8b_00103 [Ustilaginoidea virens]|uniref:Uncharacterized protein n=1 Tax=Ustilaginoidea virens TaxID=1159556 RepID=A0A8E5ME18_USTVR|nr:uncharacterized protein UV8b_00103 [Ustilaginoidea virens]QUC15862.1 hypothetical protein UV8b_00103 [Ustilaginoidea virens]